MEFARWSMAPVGLLPVVTFLLLLVYLDSYRLVKLRLVLVLIVAGGLVAGTCYWINGQLLGLLPMDLAHYSRWVAPVVEEAGKALVIVYLFRSHRIGFLVDSAILGFAVGAGFALVENFYYLHLSEDTSLVIWIVRGFGTALMHGGVVAIFGVMSQTLAERSMKIHPGYFVPGWLVAVAVHSIFNHFYVSPVMSTVGTVLTLPPLLYLVFWISERRTHDWLEADFDEDSALIRMIDSGDFSSTHAGVFLAGMQHTLEGPVVADMLCYLRLYTELALRAKGVLLMRENGLDVPMDASTRDKFTELRYLEKSIGATGCLAMRPFLQMTHKDLWQMYVLDE
ncbi:MAG: PrsW family glutamic-type intramembrane protease [Thermomonas sp.]